MSTTSSVDENLTYSPYQLETFIRTLRWIQVKSFASNNNFFTVVFAQLGYLKTPLIVSQSNALYNNIAKTITPFSRLYDEGRALMEVPSVIFSSDFTGSNEISFTIASSQDLVAANRKLKAMAEKIISATFNSQSNSSTSSLTEMQRLCLTRTKFLSPLSLSEVLNGAISPDDALLLLSCLGLQKNKKIVPICDSMTGCFHSNFQANMLTSGYKLIFLDPIQLFTKLPKASYNPGLDIQMTDLLIKELKLIIEIIKEELQEVLLTTTPSIQLSLWEVLDVIGDHEDVWPIIEKLETFFPPSQTMIIEEKKAIIKQRTAHLFQHCRELVGELPTNKMFDESLQIIEAETRFILAAEKKANLEHVLHQHREKICEFLKTVSQDYKIADVSFIIRWNVQGIQIMEKMDITKTCVVSRRVYYPSNLSQVIGENERVDWVYFSSASNQNSVASYWKSLCQVHGFLDEQLADYFLAFYQGQQIPELEAIPDVKGFLAFLAVLLFGKEPAYDSASIAANFILLLSVKLGIKTFEKALEEMPMISRGAISAKQFLLHVSGKPLDSIAHVQYKNPDEVTPSIFLPSAATFLGSANDWLQIYESVGTTAIACCRHLFFKNVNPENPDLLDLCEKLGELLEKPDLEVWGIPLLLQPTFENRFLVRNPEDLEVRVQLHKKNKYAEIFLGLMGHAVVDLDNASEECVRFLTTGIDPNNSHIQELHKMIDNQESQRWQEEVLSELKQSMKGNVYREIKRMLASWNPLMVCQQLGIQPHAFSSQAIEQLNQAWLTHFDLHLSAFQSYSNFKKLRMESLDFYRFPVSCYDLAFALDPENAIGDDDALAKWAIKYVLSGHPLRHLST
jgi:hypothetical protein